MLTMLLRKDFMRLYKMWKKLLFTALATLFVYYVIHCFVFCYRIKPIFGTLEIIKRKIASTEKGKTTLDNSLICGNKEWNHHNELVLHNETINVENNTEINSHNNLDLTNHSTNKGPNTYTTISPHQTTFQVTTIKHDNNTR